MTKLKKIDNLKRIMKTLTSFLQDNPKLNLKSFNFFDPKAVGTLQFPQKTKKETLLESLKTLQRLFRLSNDIEVAQHLLQAGVHSAWQIASMPKHRFVADYSKCFTPNGRSAEVQAQQVYRRALAVKSKTVLTYTAIAQHKNAHYQTSRFDNLSGLTDTNFDNLPSYQDLFGGLDFYTYPDCRTVYSPAAYFVDLMRLQDGYLNVNRSEHPLTLQSRRPDLWNLELNCDNTHTEISKLSIVNEILIMALSDIDGYQDLNEGKIYSLLQTFNYPFNFPVCFPLIQIRHYLKQSRTQLAQLWKDLLPEPSTSSQQSFNNQMIAMETLGFFQDQWKLYVTTENNTENLCKYYGLPSKDDITSDLTLVTTFLQQTGLSYEGLNELLYEDLSASEITQQSYQEKFFINSGNQDPITMDSSMDSLENLSVDRIDCIHRFIRMARAIQWSFSDLDWVIQTLGAINDQSKTTNIKLGEYLPYLAWMKTLTDEKKLSINAVCAFLYQIKDFGSKYGPTFFDQIFYASQVLNPPKWVDENGSHNLIWTVPNEASIDTAIDSNTQQIQSALGVALHVSQDELLAMAHAILSTQSINDQQLPLSLENLSLLYRLSLIPIVTGLSIKDANHAYALSQYTIQDTQQKDLLEALAKSSGAEAFSIITQLTPITQWFKDKKIALDQVDYWLTGSSTNVTLQNQILGNNAISTFIQSLQADVIPFTQQDFQQAVGSLLNSVGIPNLSDSLWNFLTIPFFSTVLYSTPFVNSEGIILSVPESVDISKFLLSNNSIDSVNASNIGNILSTTLDHFQQQQQTFAQKLSGLYNISLETAPIIASWGGLSLDELMQTDAATQATDQLQLLQRYSNWIRALGLNPMEVNAIDQHPEYFGFRFSTGFNGLDLPTLQTLCTFKDLVQYFQDTQNRLLDYFDTVKNNPNDKDTATSLLSTITQWNSDQLLTLINNLWTSTSNDSTEPWGTVSGIVILKNNFDAIKDIGIDVTTLYQLMNLMNQEDSSDTMQQTAESVWAGLQKRFHQDQKALTKIQDKLNNELRDALVPLTIYQLNNPEAGINITDTRDLYEYLLIDVNVDGIVQTSRIAEAISAIQLYIYRCRNYLEQGVTASTDLNNWWPWMKSYRMWQANREVFLYPENYIEPELRDNATTLFSNLENTLKQGDLTDVESAFQSYVDSLSQIADLSITGSAVYDQFNQNTNESEKFLCLVGAPHQQPSTYYYLTAIFTQVQDSDQYVVAQWNEWLPITTQMQPVGKVIPVFAFGKWFVFWVEQQQSGASVSNNDATQNQASYTAYIKYSHLNSSQQWIPAQTLGTYDLGSNTINPIGDGMSSSYWQQVYPTYSSASQTLFIPYGDVNDNNKNVLFTLTEGIIGQGLKQVIRYASSTVPDLQEPLTQTYASKEGVGFVYYQVLSDISLSSSGTLSFWFCLNKLPGSGSVALITDETNNISVNSNGDLIDQNNTTIAPGVIQPEQWNQLTWPSYTIFSLNMDSENSIDFMSDIIQVGTAFIVAYSSEEQIYFAKFTNSYDQWTPPDSIKITFTCKANPLTESVTLINLIAVNDTIYIALADSDNRIYTAKLDFNDPWQDNEIEAVDTTQSCHLNCNICLYNYDDQVYMLFVGNNSQQIIYCDITDTNGNLYDSRSFPSTTVSEASSSTNPSYCFFSGHQYVAWGSTDNPPKLNWATLDSMKTPNSEDSVMLGTSVSLFVDCDQRLRIVWLDSFSQINTGWIVDTGGTVQNSIQEKTTLAKTRKVAIGNVFGIGFYYVNGGTTYTYIPAIYLNNISYFFHNSFSSDDNKIHLGDKNNKTLISMQEILAFGPILDGSVCSQLYTNSREQITTHFDQAVPMTSHEGSNPAFSNDSVDTSVPTLAQPNWNIVTYADAYFLVVPFTNSSNSVSLDIFRLNSTAIRQLNTILSMGDLEEFLSISSQQLPEIPFESLQLNSAYFDIRNIPSDQLDFIKGPMSNYYWELFFHAPFLIAHQLQSQLQFEAAKQWYEYIFNPTIDSSNWQLGDDSAANDQYWRFIGLRSFYNPTLSVELNESWADEIQSDSTNTAQLYSYHNDPFDPQNLARLRPIAYQKTIVMHYVDTIIAWGDNLFHQNTAESINEATMLYVLAYDLLGKQPLRLGDCNIPKDETLQEIINTFNDPDLTNIPEFIINLEQKTSGSSHMNVADVPVNYISGAYFGLPENDQFLAYWDTVKQRLYNIRHSLTLDGTYEQVPVFAPALNPMQLVQQISAGDSLEQAQSDLNVSVPYYRYHVMSEKAKEVAGTAIQFGQSLLQALEKKDGEQLSLLYNTNEQSLLALTLLSKQNQLNEAKESLNALNASLQNAKDRHRYYTNLINQGWSDADYAQVLLLGGSVLNQLAAQVLKIPSIPGFLSPKIFGLANGGMDFGQAMQVIPSMLEGKAMVYSFSSELAGTIGGFQRREEDWQLQQTLAQDDINQINAQILAAQYSQATAQQELEIVHKNIDQDQKVLQFLTTKFTNQQLYQWYIGKLSSLYFQVYQLAFQLAKQAEQAWQFEKGVTTSMIQSNYWDGLHQGLLAGESLQLDLQRMEKAYMDQDQRRMEILKTISLAQLNPKALLTLKQTGTCQFSLLEQDFDIDYPGHYCRQIKSISLSFPALLGPYENIHATLTQTGSKTLLTPDEKGATYLIKGGEFTNHGSLKINPIANQQVVLSQGLNDSGLFVLNFDDPRYLPFEGTGAVSDWQLDMPFANNPIDFDSLSDVIIQLNYTASLGDSNFKNTVQSLMPTFNGYRIFTAAQEFSSSWYDFLNNGNPLQFTIAQQQFRKNLKDYQVNNLYIQLELTEMGQQITDMPTLKLSISNQSNHNQTITFQKDSNTGIVSAFVDFASSYVSVSNQSQKWSLTIESDVNGLFTPNNVSNQFLIMNYSGSLN
jgi:hypothetical protein